MSSLMFFLARRFSILASHHLKQIEIHCSSSEENNQQLLTHRQD